jgi:hypothetical protein
MIVYLELSSFRSFVADATHYFGRLRTERYPSVDLDHVLTESEAAQRNARERAAGETGICYRPGSKSQGFGSIEAVERRAVEVYGKHFPGARLLVRGNMASASPKPVLDGPQEVREKAQRIVEQANALYGGKPEPDDWDAYYGLCDEWAELVRPFV